MAVLTYLLTYYPNYIIGCVSNGYTYDVRIQEEMTEDDAERIKNKLEHIAIAGTRIRIKDLSKGDYYVIILTWRFER